MVIDSLPDGCDGLFGLELLMAFQVRVDFKNECVMTPRGREELIEHEQYSIKVIESEEKASTKKGGGPFPANRNKSPKTSCMLKQEKPISKRNLLDSPKNSPNRDEDITGDNRPCCSQGNQQKFFPGSQSDSTHEIVPTSSCQTGQRPKPLFPPDAPLRKSSIESPESPDVEYTAQHDVVFHHQPPVTFYSNLERTVKEGQLMQGVATVAKTKLKISPESSINSVDSPNGYLCPLFPKNWKWSEEVTIEEVTQEEMEAEEFPPNLDIPPDLDKPWDPNKTPEFPTPSYAAMYDLAQCYENNFNQWEHLYQATSGDSSESSLIIVEEDSSEIESSPFSCSSDKENVAPRLPG